jgi:hypothetical protein
MEVLRLSRRLNSKLPADEEQLDETKNKILYFE